MARKKTQTPVKPDGRSKRGKYQEWIEGEGLTKIAAWSRNGLTQEDIAHNIGCSLSTFKEWIKKYPALSATMKITREVADIRVENALYKRAVGYEYEEVVNEADVAGGLSYQSYLTGLLAMERKEALSMRSLDLIESNLQIKTDECMTGVEIQSKAVLRRGVKDSFTTAYEYE